MKKTIVVLGLLALILAVASCSASQSGSGGGLTGKVWALTELRGNPPMAGSGITAEFGSDGQVSGSSGCNRYSGTYTVSGKNITIRPTSMTLIACEEAEMDQEDAYISALVEAKTYTVKGDQLTLVGADNSKLAVHQARSQPLAGTSWQVIGYNNGKEAVVSVTAGTTLTAEFGTDGNLSGNSGCNTYNGPYTITGNQIKIGPLATTRMACGGPAGVMEQEALYLAALESAATCKIEGMRLQLRTQDGTLAAEFGRNLK